MLVYSFLPKPPSTCTAGVKTQLLPLSFSLTDRIASLNVKILLRPRSAIPAPHSQPRHWYQCLLIRSSPRRTPAIWNLNFSRIDNATLQLIVSAAAIGGTQTAKVRVYATNYNVLRVMSGMGGLAYSN